MDSFALEEYLRERNVRDETIKVLKGEDNLNRVVNLIAGNLIRSANLLLSAVCWRPNSGHVLLIFFRN